MLDTNIIVGAFVAPYGVLASIVSSWRLGEIEVVVSEEILDEYKRALGYEKIRKVHSMSNEDIEEAIDELKEIAIVVEPKEKLLIVQGDPDDNKFFECALAGDADVIVSGDKKVLDVGVYKSVYVLPPAQFARMIKEEVEALL
ncbi:MAG: putative toxin-antitoxin system toxin component, PIN family [Chloroflexota bacterium]|nr:putative toxin-antitoxin system toxin component, PIN family [Chloroflexota bacterium]